MIVKKRLTDEGSWTFIMEKKLFFSTSGSLKTEMITSALFLFGDV
jgi:hypothetical protein